jgi:hypothetical protein
VPVLCLLSLLTAEKVSDFESVERVELCHATFRFARRYVVISKGRYAILTLGRCDGGIQRTTAM